MSGAFVNAENKLIIHVEATNTTGTNALNGLAAEVKEIMSKEGAAAGAEMVGGGEEGGVGRSL